MKRKATAFLLFFLICLAHSGIAFGEASRLLIEGSTTEVAGKANDLTITAVELAGSTAEDYDGRKTLYFSGALPSLNPIVNPTVTDDDGDEREFGSRTDIEFRNGIASVRRTDRNGQMRLYRAGPTTVSVSDGTISSAGGGDLEVTVTPGPLSNFNVGISSPQKVGQPFSGTNTVEALDTFGNTVTNFEASQDGVALTSSLGGTLSGLGSAGTNLLNQASDFTNGIADLSSKLVYRGASGNGTLLAMASSGKSGVSNSFLINPADASKLRFIQQPTHTQPGAMISPPVALQLLDDNEDVAPVADVPVTVTLTSGSGTLSGTTTRGSNSSGIVTFNELSIDTPGEKALAASGNNLSSVTSSPFLIQAAQATQLVFVQQPTTTAAGAAITPAVTVQLKDGGGVDATDDGVPVTITLNGSGTLGGTVTRTTVGGLATFSDLSVTQVGQKTLTASSTGLASATSQSFDITPGPARKLVFIQLPGNTPLGQIISPTPTVQLRDAFDNDVPAAGVGVTMALTSGTGALGGTVTRNTSGTGLATFDDLTINATGPKTLTASSSGLTSAVSAPFTIEVGAATQLAFVQQPTNASVGVVISPAVTVQLKDAGGNNVTTNGVSVAVSLNGTGSLNGTLTRTTSNGVATFDNLSVSQTGQKTLTAASSGLNSATSQTFDVGAGAAANLVIQRQPSGAAVAGQPFARQPIIAITDGSGNVVTGDNSTVVTVQESAGGPGGLTGTRSVTAVNGIATFTNLAETKAGTVTLQFTSQPSHPAVTSNNIVVIPAVATRLVFVQQPSNAAAGDVIAPAITVQLRDAFDNNVPDSGVDVTMTLSSGNGTLSGNTTRNTNSSGLATFANLRISAAGEKVFTASSPGLLSAVSSPFTIGAGAASQLAFVQQPTNTVAGAVITPAVTVRLKDATGNDVSTNGVPIAMSLTGSGTLGGTLTQNTSNGVARFNNLSLSQAGTKQLTASSAGLTSATSQNFQVTAGSAARLIIQRQPSADAVAGVAFGRQPVIAIVDGAGNLVTTDNTTTVTARESSGAATLQGTVTVRAVNGIVTFSNLALTRTGTYRLDFSSQPALTGVQSSNIAVGAAAAAKLVFVQQPANATAGAAIAPPVTVRLRDAFNNDVANSGVAVRMSLSSGTGTLAGTPTRSTNSSGLATFNDLSIDQAGQKVLTASSAGLTSAISSPFTIGAGPASALAFVQQPTNAVAGGTITPAVTVQLKDAAGNNLTTNGVSVTLALSGTGALNGTLTQPTVNGIATFGDLSVTQTGQKTLTTSSAGLQSATSQPFTITPGSANQLAFLQPPGNTTAGAVLTPAVTVRIVDANANTIDVSGTPITLSVAGGDSLLGTFTRNSVNGIATFDDIRLRIAGQKSLIAASPGLPAIASPPFTVAPGAAARLAVENAADGTGTVLGAQTVPSGNTVTAYAITRDAFGNFVANVEATSWVLQNITGGVLAGDLTPSADKKSAQFTGKAAGSATIAASLTGLPPALSGVLTVVAGTQASRILVETAPDGSGTALDARTLTAGGTLNAYAIARDASNNFVGNVAATQWSVLDATGGIVAQDLAPAPDRKSATFSAHLSGQARIQASAMGITGTRSGLITVIAGAASRLEPVSGTQQETQVNSEYAERLVVKVSDAFGNPVGGVTVTFTTPASGPGGGFRGGNNSAISDAAGVATSAVFVANSFSGTFAIVASTAGVGTPVTFTLTNRSGSGANIAVLEGAAQSAVVGAAYAVRFKVTVKDDAGNAVGGALVRFSAPASGPSGNFPGGLVDSARTTAIGEATSPIFTANFVAGSYSVIASTEAGKTVSLHLTNTPGPLTRFAVELERGGRIDTQFVGIPFAIKIRALDAYDNAVASFSEGIVISSTGGLSIGAGTTPRLVSGVLSSYMVGFQETGTFTIVATRSGGGASGTSYPFVVGNPRPVVNRVSPSSGSPGQTILVSVFGRGFLNGVTSVSFGDGIGTSTVIESDTLMTVMLQIANAVAPGSRDVTVFNVPPVGGVAFLANGFTVGDHPGPTVSGISPSSGVQFQALRLLVRGTNFLGNGFTHLHFSGEGITVDSLLVDSSTVIIADIRIGATAAPGPRDIIIVNDGPGGGSDTLHGAFSVTAGVLAAPSLLQPPNGAQNQPATVQLTWGAGAGAVKYQLEVATDQAFTRIVVADSTPNTSYQVGPLSSASVYYWHVKAIGATGASAWSSTWSFDNLPPIAQTVSLNALVNYPDLPNPTDYSPSDYRIVGLPGASNTRVTNFIPGTQDLDWRLFWDNGGASNYLISFDGSSTFTFTPGRAFWLLKKGPWTVNVTISAAPIDSVTRSVLVPIHSGWNLIANPLMWSIPWTDIQAANGTTEPIYKFEGLYNRSDGFEPYVGYYFFNDPVNPLEILKIPYGPGIGKGVAKSAEPGGPDSWTVGVDLRLGKYIDQATSFGVNPEAAMEKDAFDHHRPRAFGDLPSVYFSRPEWDSAYTIFASDIRPPFRDLSSWKLDVSSRGPETGELELLFRGLEGVPAGMEVYLVNPAAATYHNLRKDEGKYQFVPASPFTEFRLLVGKEAALADELAGVVPRTFALDQNYPNPFNPSTAIPVALPVRADVELKIYNVLGQEVKTLHAGSLDAGRHLFLWDGTNNLGSAVASGVYISRLTSGDGVRLGRKMLLVR